MRRYLLVALWPAGLAIIATTTVLAARRASAAPAAGVTADQAAAQPAEVTEQARRDGVALSSAPDARAPSSAPLASGTAGMHEAPGWSSPPPATRADWLPDLIRLSAISGAGGIVSYGVMAVLGPSVVNHGPAIDEPIFRWTNSHQVDWWAAVMRRLNKVGNTWTTWGAAGTAAVCLGVSWRRQRWLPPTALGAAILVDHYATLALRRTFNRLGPPTSPLGTYPAGGTDRVVLFYGLIAHMLWREFSGSRQGRIWAVGAVAALSFNQAYCREYLSKHWFTDIISGLIYGVVLLAPFIIAVRVIAGPVGEQARGGRIVSAEREHSAEQQRTYSAARG